MFQIPSLALRINPGVWWWAVGQHVWNVPPTASFPHAVKRKKTNSLTLLLQNHLDHLNNLLRDLRHWHIHNLLHDSFRHPLLRNHLDHVNDLLVDPWYRNIHDLLLDLQPDDGHSATAAASGRSGARCAPVMATIKCTMHTCQTLQHKLPRTAVKRKAMEWTKQKHKRWNPQQLPANSSDCSTR